MFYSYFQPNGWAEMFSSDKERVYFVVNGSITVKGTDEEHVLIAGDVIYIAPGEEREIFLNKGTLAELLIFVVTP